MSGEAKSANVGEELASGHADNEGLAATCDESWFSRKRLFTTGFGVHSLLALTMIFMLARGFKHAPDLFVGPHAFDSADVATTARTFATLGVLRLHAIPINNNPPVIRSDAYTHWPPLLPIVLSFVFRAFGSSERTVHLFMLAVFAATALLIYLLARAWLNSTAAALAALFWMVLPVELQFGDISVQQPFAVLFLLAALLALERHRGLAGVLFFLAVCSSWEAALIGPAFWIMAKRYPELKLNARVALLACTTGLFLVAALFLFGNPKAALDTIQTAKFYMGVSHTYSAVSSPALQNQLSLGEQIRLTLLNNFWMLGPLGLGAVLQLILRRPRPIFEKLAPLGIVWLVWCVAMNNHTARHPFELVIAAPTVAIAMAWLASPEFHSGVGTRGIQQFVFVALAVAQAVLLPVPRMSDGYDPFKLVQYARDIKSATEPNSIVLAPLVSAVPLYYSERHIIRGIDSPAEASNILPQLSREFPGSPVYLALPPELVTSFGENDAQAVTTRGSAVIFRLK